MGNNCIIAEQEGILMKDTDELKRILQNTHIENVGEYIKNNQDSMILDDRPFTNYMHQKIKEKKMTQQDIFVNADVTERYGYKLLSEQKRTKQRDVIIRICYAANFTLYETQKALRIYGMPELYIKYERDAVLMICFNERPGTVIDVNNILKKHKLDPLRTSGLQE